MSGGKVRIITLPCHAGRKEAFPVYALKRAFRFRFFSFFVASLSKMTDSVSSRTVLAVVI